MDINQLQYFYQIFQDGSISEASKHLYISQQGLSQSMRRLEEELGVTLFFRGRSGITLTPYGELLKSTCEDILPAYNQFQESVKSCRTNMKGTLNIGIANNIITGLNILSMDTLLSFQDHYPSIVLNFTEQTTNQCLEQLRQKKLDLICVEYNTSLEQFHYLEFAQSEIVAIIPSQHFLSARKEITRSDLKAENLILMSGSDGASALITEWLSEIIAKPKLQKPSLNLSTYLELIYKDTGIGFTQKDYAPSIIQEKARLVPFTEAEKCRCAFYWMYQKGEKNSVLNEFLNFVLDKTT